MCTWSAQCDELNNCKAGPPTLGCARGGGDCQTCALGFLSVQMPKIKALHKSPHATLGMLTPLGWKITRPGKGSGLEVGDIITSLNGLPLNEGIELAANVIVEFGNYNGSIVLFSLLPVAGFKVERRECERS